MGPHLSLVSEISGPPSLSLSPPLASNSSSSEFTWLGLLHLLDTDTLDDVVVDPDVDTLDNMVADLGLGVDDLVNSLA
jgi:hypothetical protein